MIWRCLSIFILIFSLVASCAGINAKDDIRSRGFLLINVCANKLEELIGKEWFEEVDRAYVYIFENGFDVAFTRGAVGTFGKRSLDYKQVMACGVSDGKVVFLGAPLEEPLIDELEQHPYENYEEDVIELLFMRENGKFEFCCSQPFDEKNIDRHNPDYPWKKGMIE